MPALARSLSRSRSRWRFSPHCSLRPSLEAIPLRRHDCSRAAPLSICRVLIPTPRCRTFWSGNVRHVRSSSSSLASASSSSSSSADSESSSSDEVKIRFGKQNASAPSGTLLRSAMLMNGLSPHNEGARTINCRGLGTCGTCAVRVLDGRVEPATWTQKERLRLNFPPHGPPTNQKLRLACQVRLCAGQDVTLQKMGGFWGSTDEPAPEPPPFTAPLGPLEFALDRDSWGSRPAGQDNKK